MSNYNYLSIEEENRLHNKLDKYKFGCILASFGLIISIVLNVLFIIDKRTNNEYSEIIVSEYIDLEEVSDSGNQVLYRDKTTNVLYIKLLPSGGITPIINPDGTAKLYEGD